MKAWRIDGYAPLKVAINVSAVQFSNPGLGNLVAEILEKTELPHQQLELEITESLLMRDIDRAIPLLSEFRKMGVGIWIDDFGTGYSSLSYLKKLPITGLKIDRSFVKNMQKDSNDAGIAAAIVGLAKNLNVSVVAEGVELEAQLKLLDKQGCHYAQGYLYAKPLTHAEFEDWTKQWNSQFETQVVNS